MKVNACMLGGVVLGMMLTTAASAQTRVEGTPRYYSSKQVGYSTYSTRMASHGVGCADCAGGYAGPSCDGEIGCGYPGCHGRCDRCCPRVLPAVARGIGAVADLVGGTLDCIFSHPRYYDGCCETSGSCCARPRTACCAARPCVRRATCGGCGGGGCASCGSDYIESDGAPTPMEAEPATPPAPAPAEARVYRRSSSAKPASSSSAARRPAVAQRPATKATSIAAVREVAPKSAGPREWNDRIAADARPLSASDEEVAPVSRTSKAPVRAMPSNPLR